MLKFTSYLFFDGNCGEAFELYAELFGGKLAIARYSDMPEMENIPADQRDKIANVQLTVGSQELMGSDAPPQNLTKPGGYRVAIQLDDEAKTEQIFQRLAKRGSIDMPLDETSWAKKFGMVTDRFGTRWMVSCGMAG